jgi:Mycobacterium membrane protein
VQLRILPKRWIEPVGLEYGSSCSTHVELDVSGERASIDPLDDDNAIFSSWSTGGRLGAVVEPGVRDVDIAEARSDPAVADLRDLSQPSDRGLPPPRRAGQPALAPRARRKSHRNRRIAIFSVARRLWIPLLILVVIGAGGLTVARLHGVFGAEKGRSYVDTQTNVAARFDPHHLTYEVFGPPGTVATISYFDVNADPQHVEGVRLPWSLTFTTTPTTAVEKVVAQGDSDSIGCRILIDGVVKAEKITHHEASALTYCKPMSE